jgi:hypothetical protein
MSHSTLGWPASRDGLADIPRKSASTVKREGGREARRDTSRCLTVTPAEMSQMRVGEPLDGAAAGRDHGAYDERAVVRMVRRRA